MFWRWRCGLINPLPIICVCLFLIACAFVPARRPGRITLWLTPTLAHRGFSSSLLDECLHEDLRIGYSVLFWDHATRNGENAAEDRKIEKDRSMRSNFEMEKEFGFNDGGKQEDSAINARKLD